MPQDKYANISEPTIAALAPLLYSPAFSDTLILVGSIQPLPEIESLTSPSHLLSLGNGSTIFPTVQPFQPPAAALKNASHPLHALLKHASALADAHRHGTTVPDSPPSRPLSWASRSRRGSTTSMMSGIQTPPTPPRSRFAFGRRSAASSPMTSPTGSAIDLSSMNFKKNRAPSVMSMPAHDQPRGLRRVASYLREKPSSEGSPFDAVINFIPPAVSRMDGQRALQDMLQHSVVVTTAVLPVMTSACTDNSVSASISVPDLAPLSLLHIVPSDAPSALAPVIERFLVPLLPAMGMRTRRQLFGCVTGLGPWMAPATDPTVDGLPGAETLIFGGLRSLDQSQGLRSQALLTGWNQCVRSDGTLVEASQRGESPPAFSRHTSALALSEMRHSQSNGRTLSQSGSPTSTGKTSPVKESPIIPQSRSIPALGASAGLQGTRSTSYSSRLDPRARENRPHVSTSDLPTSNGLHTSPDGKMASAGSGSFARSPSGLRNPIHATLPVSPPTPELDPSSSSCSSSSVVDPIPEERSVNSGNSGRRVVSAPVGKTPTSKPRSTLGFGSLFKRARGLKA